MDTYLQLKPDKKQYSVRKNDKGKGRLEKYHATLKEKEARYQRLVTLASREGDATKEKSPINKGEEESPNLTNVEMKRSCFETLKDTFTLGKAKSKENYFKLERISLLKLNKENGLENGSAIVDEIWAKQRSAHDRSGLGYKKDKGANHWTPITKFEGSASSSKDQYSTVKWKYENPFKIYC